MSIKRTSLGVLLSIAACAKADYVKTSAVLGKVVVYRNGVAYFERRAKLDGDTLRMKVPVDKVDDFLKSLTVRDAKSGASLPISFPHKGQAQAGMVDMVVRIVEGSSGEVVLTYITDSPAWKPSYRIVVDDQGKVKIEGWAIVDNTSGEDWNDVLVGVGSSSALSFRYDLWSIRDVHRQTLGNSDHFAVAPPQGASTYGESSGEKLVVLGDLSERDLNMPKTHPKRSMVFDDADAEEMAVAASIAAAPGRSFSGTVTNGGLGRGAEVKPHDSDAVGERAQRRLALAAQREQEKQQFSQNQQKIKALAQRLKSANKKVVVEGWAGINEADKDAKALDRANVLRNQLIEEGVPPANLVARSAGSQEGRPAGVRVVVSDEGAAPIETADTPPVGESHFESKSPMSVQQNASVMVSIVKEKTAGEIVYLYDSESSRGNSSFAFKTVRFVNPTESTLEGGPVTVYGESRFVGEGLTDPIPPQSMAMVPFALDRQVVVEPQHVKRDKITRLVKLERGALTTEVKHIRETRYKLKNRLHKPVTVYLRHSILKGWQLLEAPKKSERLGDAHLFPVALAKGEFKEVVIEEGTPMTKTFDLRSPETLDIVRVFLSEGSRDPRLAKDMKELWTMHRKMADTRSSIVSLRERLGDYRVRMDELHVQIVSLKAVRSGGSLLRSLQEKMKDVSERVQKGTIALVEEQEQLMLARIRFQDAVAELSLEGDKALAKAQPAE